MRIAIGTDHAGFLLKESVIQAVKETGHEPIDLGAYDDHPSDYPDFAEKVSQAVISGQAERGILLCGSGIGICIAANKIPGIYASIAHDPYSAAQGVEHDAMNVLCLGGRVIGSALARSVIMAFLGAVPSDEPRHQRRVSKVRALEKNR